MGWAIIWRPRLNPQAFQPHDTGDLALPLISKSALFRLVPSLARYVPIVARGLAIGFFVLAVGTVALNSGNYASPLARYTVAGLFLIFGMASLAIGHYVRPILRWLMRSMLGGPR
jgi:hypothetical protein